MKKPYVAPIFQTELFEANQAVASTCYVATMYCAIPGEDDEHCADGTKMRRLHSTCASVNIIFNDTTASGFETSAIGTSSPVTGVTIGQPAANLQEECSSNIGAKSSIEPGLFHCTWTSGMLGTYNHYGIMRISQISADHPNRS